MTLTLVESLSYLASCHEEAKHFATLTSNSENFAAVAPRYMMRNKVGPVAFSVLHKSPTLGFSLKATLKNVPSDLTQYVVMRCDHLQTMVLSWNTTVTNEDLKAIGTYLPQLETLELAGCKNIGDRGVYFLHEGMRRTSLMYLDLSFCVKITNRAIAQLCAFVPSLRSLDLVECFKLDDEIFVHLMSLNHLEHLDVTDCPMLTRRNKKQFKTGQHVKLQEQEIPKVFRMYGVEGGSEGADRRRVSF